MPHRTPPKCAALALAAASVLLAACAGLPAHAGERSRELYVSGFAGGAFGSSSDVDEDDLPRLRRVLYEDVKTDASAVFGASFGEWHIDSASGFTWGFRADLSRFHPDAPEQSVRATGSSDGSDVDTTLVLGAVGATSTTYAGSVLASGRFGGGRDGRGWAFWLGGGGGVERLSVRLADGREDTSGAFVWQALAGGQHWVSRRLAGFAECRTTSARHEFAFGTSRSDVRSSRGQLVGGISVHF